MSGPVKELVLGARKPATRRDRVSVVDDDDDTREAIASLVRSTGLEVETFASAQDFLEVAGKRLPDCLVLDVDARDSRPWDHRRQAPAGHHRRPLLALPATSPASPAITSSAFSRPPTGSSAALRVLPLGSA